MREPIYQDVPANRKSPVPRPCVDYTRTYLPTGQQVANKTFHEQKPGVNRLKIEDWQRAPLAYDPVFEGETHHLVQDRNSPTFRIETNFRDILEPKAALEKIAAFEKKRARKDSDVI